MKSPTEMQMNCLENSAIEQILIRNNIKNKQITATIVYVHVV